MKLFYKPGACSMAAHILLNETGADYQLEKVDTDAGTTETGASYLETNPRGYVPALKLDDGAVLTENVAILHWIGEQFPDVAPGNDNQPLQRYRQLELLSFLSSELHKAFSPYFSGKTFSESEQAANRKKLDTKLGQFENLLESTSPFLLGTTFSVVDAYAFVILNWTNFIGVSLDGWPQTKAYVARIGARPSTRKTLAEEGLAA
ncbi:glutathione binding-like protein [Roseibium sp. MMSF_3544]|uniref:glutathione binding-like protein n=1 Tax=unclassified Roseibium TaxID=2629323 RepID=UPI00273E52EE|nr:glutathione binding-like protein [Roseibium sp. MMSF_3544]